MDYVAGNNKRRHPRYDTDMKLIFKVKYDINVKVEFTVLDGVVEDNVNRRHIGTCSNVSVDGLLITSGRQLSQKDVLLLEVYDPLIQGPVKMEGHVRWCKKSPVSDNEHGDIFDSGVQILSVNGKSVSDSIYFDNKHMAAWSALLETLFGTLENLNKLTAPTGKKEDGLK